MIVIDLKSKTPIYEQICQGISELIVKGNLNENDRLPSERVLAKKLCLNPNTVSRAYRKMEHEGIIYSIPGKGCFVSDRKEYIEKKLMREFSEKALQLLNIGISSKYLLETINDLKNGIKQKGGAA